MKELFKWFFMKIIYPLTYRLSAFRPIKQKAVFVEIRSDTLTDNFVLLADALRKSGRVRVQVCCLNNLKGGRLGLIRRALPVLWAIGDAKVIFVDDSSNIMGAFRLRRGSFMVQIWHACGAFKKWGFSIAGKRFGDDRREMQRYPYHRNYSLVSVSGEAVRPAYVEAFGLEARKGIVQALGVSRTDIFFRKSFLAGARGKLYRLWEGIGSRRVILYAPTFRGQAESAVSPEIIDLPLWRQSLGREYVLLLTHHPFVRRRPACPEELRDFVRDMTEDMTTEELLAAADICITDYSSLVFEFSLREKPMIFWAYDKDEYDDWRGFYFPYDEFVPGPVVRTNEEAIAAVRASAAADPAVIRRFRQRYMGACDGHATERILKAAGLM